MTFQPHISVDAGTPSDPLPVAADHFAPTGMVILRLGPVSFACGDLATACDLNERIAVELSRLLADARQAETLPLGGEA